MVQSLTQPDDFRRLLQRRPLARHAGWSLHACKPEGQASADLSTRESSRVDPPVEDSGSEPRRECEQGEALVLTGVVLSRRNVRRATTRNLMRRIWRVLLAESPGATLDGWQVVLRRTAPWSRETFRSTQSAPLRRQLRGDLTVLRDALVAAERRATASPQPSGRPGPSRP